MTTCDNADPQGRQGNLIGRRLGIPVVTGTVINGHDAIFHLQESFDHQAGIVDLLDPESILAGTVDQSNARFGRGRRLAQEGFHQRGIAAGMLHDKGNDALEGRQAFQKGGGRHAATGFLVDADQLISDAKGSLREEALAVFVDFGDAREFVGGGGWGGAVTTVPTKASLVVTAAAACGGMIGTVIGMGGGCVAVVAVELDAKLLVGAFADNGGAQELRAVPGVAGFVHARCVDRFDGSGIDDRDRRGRSSSRSSDICVVQLVVVVVRLVERRPNSSSRRWWCGRWRWFQQRETQRWNVYNRSSSRESDGRKTF